MQDLSYACQGFSQAIHLYTHLHRFLCFGTWKKYYALLCYFQVPLYPCTGSLRFCGVVCFCYISSYTSNFENLLLFSPSHLHGNMTSADFWQLKPVHHCMGFLLIRKSICQTSPVKSSNFHPMSPLHLHCGIRVVLDFVLISKLVRSTYALYAVSVRRCGILPLSFLQIPPHGGHPCCWLMIPTTKLIADFHRRVTAHVGQTYFR